MIFLIILITFPFDDVVMLLGENRCWSLKGERGLIREVTLVEEGWLINQVGPPVPPDLYSTQEGHPSWFPLVRYIGDMSLTPGDFCQDSCPGGYPRYHSILSPPPPPQAFLVFSRLIGFFLATQYFRNISVVHGFPGLTVSASLPPEFCPFLSYVFSVRYLA